MKIFGQQILGNSIGVLVSILCTACAISPDIADSTGLKPEQIVRSIRCEMLDALRYKAGGAIQQFTKGAEDQDTDELARSLVDGEITLTQALAHTKSPAAKAFIKKYLNTAIAYEFTLDITEENKLESTLDFVGALTHRVVTFELSGTNDLVRQNVVHFYITDLLRDLLEDPIIRCDLVRDVRNIEFPIAGRIGVDKQVNTFFSLNETSHLSVSNISGLDFDKLPTLAVTYNFQTTITGSANPKVMVTPVGKGYNLTNFGLTATANRKDFHKVIISLATPLNGKRPALSYLPPGVVIDPAINRAVAKAKTPQEVAALAAIADTKLNQFLNRSFP